MVGRAFSILGDPVARKRYDLYGSDMPSSTAQSATASRMDLDPEEIFRSFFKEFASKEHHPFFREFATKEDPAYFFRSNAFPFSGQNTFHTTFSSQGFGPWRFNRRNEKFSFGNTDNETRQRTQQEPLTPRQVLAQLIPGFIILLLCFLNNFSVQVLFELVPILVLFFLTFLGSFLLR